MPKPTIYCIKLSPQKENLDHYVHALENHFDCVTINCLDPLQQIEIFLPCLTFSKDDLEEKINSILAHHKIPPVTIEANLVEERDWVGESQKIIEDVELERFIISEDPKPHKDGKIHIQLNPGLAFGTGTHSSTQGCLDGLTLLPKHPKKILDMGCGSGILSIAAAKLFSAKVIAVDNDAFSVLSTKNNSLRNNVEDRVTAVLGEGYNALSSTNTFDLILCNIFAKPLCEMAPLLKLHLNKNGFAVLSGFLTNQEEEVIERHMDCGLSLYRSITIQDWSTVILKNE